MSLFIEKKAPANNFLPEDLPFFRGLAPNDIDTLISHSKLKNYSKRSCLFRKGEAARSLYIVLEGWVKLYHLTSEGEEIIAAMMSHSDVISDASIFKSGTYSYYAVTVEDARILEIPASALKEQVRKHPDFAIQVMTIMTQKINRLLVSNGHLSKMTARQRLSCLLLRLSSWMKGKGGTFSLPYDKSIMALQLGMDPATLSRVFSKLKDAGVSRKGSEIQIEDFYTLSKCCCRHCPVSADECAGRRKPVQTGAGS